MPPIHRRDFLKGSAVFTATALFAPSARAARQEPAAGQVVVGAHPWVYAARLPKNDLTPALPQIFEDLAYAGVDGVELMHTALRPDDAVDRIGELSRRHRLPVLGMSFGGAMWDPDQRQAVLDDAALILPRLAKLGGRTLGTSVGPIKGGRTARKTPAQLDAQAEVLRRLIALAESHGITVNLHNHTYEVENDQHDLKGTLARVPGVKLGPDLNWLLRGGVEPGAFIRQYGRQIVFLHLRDQRKDGRWSESLGEGDMDYRAIAAALREIDFRGHAVIELAHERDFTPTRPLRESFRLSREFVRRTLGY